MTRFALHSTIRADAIDDYVAQHRRIPDDLQGVFDRVGVIDWVIWRSGDRLFHLVDCDDIDDVMRRIGESPENEAWQRDIGRFVSRFHGPDGQDDAAPLAEVWALSTQRQDERRRP
ncbi:L-rhamnose mutarotase [Microbacterium sp. NPDC056052]|uniref:L-rhamnose mutarotase n=1 Tax=Microbacterium sp. NPDC056052 TaxID=3345695 RepID=UPI0035DC2FF9